MVEEIPDSHHDQCIHGVMKVMIMHTDTNMFVIRIIETGDIAAIMVLGH